MIESFSADAPELRLFAQFGGIAPTRMAAAFNDPEHFFAHMTLEELQRLTAGLIRLTALGQTMEAVIDRAIKHMRAHLGT